MSEVEQLPKTLTWNGNELVGNEPNVGVAGIAQDWPDELGKAIAKRYNTHVELMNFVNEVAKQETRGDMSGHDFIITAARRVLAKALGQS